MTPEIKAALEQELDQARVKHRDAGRGQQVPYLEGYDIIDAANRIFGFDGWSYEVESAGIASTFEVERRGARVTLTQYEARVKVSALGVTRKDVGLSLTDSDRPEAHDTAYKGAVTDALKRALRTYGPQFGNDLYDKGAGNGQRSEQQQPRQQRPAASNGTGEIQNVGQLLTWAVQTHGKNKQWVLDTLRVGHQSEIRDLADAKAALEIALEGAS